MAGSRCGRWPWRPVRGTRGRLCQLSGRRRRHWQPLWRIRGLRLQRRPGPPARTGLRSRLFRRIRPRPVREMRGRLCLLSGRRCPRTPSPRRRCCRPSRRCGRGGPRPGRQTPLDPRNRRILPIRGTGMRGWSRRLSGHRCKSLRSTWWRCPPWRRYDPQSQRSPR